MDILTTTYMISLGLVILFFVVGLSIVCYQKKKKINLLNNFYYQVEDKFVHYHKFNENHPL